MIIETKKYKVSPSFIANHLAMRTLAKWWWALALPLVACIVLSVFDTRWIIVTFAVALILYPLVLMMAYFNHALTPNAVCSTLEQSAIFDKHGITISYFGKDVSSDLLIPRRIRPDEVANWEDTGKYFIIRLTDGSEIFIPISAISDPVGVTYMLKSL